MYFFQLGSSYYNKLKALELLEKCMPFISKIRLVSQIYFPTLKSINISTYSICHFNFFKFFCLLHFALL